MNTPVHITPAMVLLVALAILFVGIAWLVLRVLEDVENERDAEIEEQAQADREALRFEMERLSEEYYYAGWIHALEFVLWREVIGATNDLDTYTVDRLRRLSEACEGWCIWSDYDGDPKWVPIAEWKQLYADHARSCASQRCRGASC